MFEVLFTTTEHAIVGVLLFCGLIKIFKLGAFFFVYQVLLVATIVPVRVKLMCFPVALLKELKPFAIRIVIMCAATGRLTTNFVVLNALDGSIVRISDCFMINQILIKSLIKQLAILIHNLIGLVNPNHNRKFKFHQQFRNSDGLA